MKIKDLYNDEKPREKLLEKGADALSVAELLAILLRSGTRKKNAIEIGRELLNVSGGSLKTLSGLSAELLMEVEGVGKEKAAILKAAFELGKRKEMEMDRHSSQLMNSPQAVYKSMGPILKHLDHEECWVLFLNRDNSLLAKEKFSSGGQDATIMDIKIIVRRALERKCSAMILVHNHPCGSAIPSSADITNTQKLRKALSPFGIQLLDHVVISHNGSYYSFADETMTNG